MTTVSGQNQSTTIKPKCIFTECWWSVFYCKAFTLDTDPIEYHVVSTHGNLSETFTSMCWLQVLSLFYLKFSKRSNSKVKDQTVTVMIWNKRSCLKGFIYEIWKPQHLSFKIYDQFRFKFWKKMVKLQSQRSEGQVMISNEKSCQQEFTCKICKP